MTFGGVFLSFLLLVVDVFLFIFGDALLHALVHELV